MIEGELNEYEDSCDEDKCSSLLQSNAQLVSSCSRAFVSNIMWLKSTFKIKYKDKDFIQVFKESSCERRSIGTFDGYNEVESKKKGKRHAVEKDSDSKDRVCAKKKRKGNKPEDNMIVACQQEAEAKVVEVKAKTNDRKAINARMSPRNLKRVLDSLTTLQ
ncbi:hypothetical protein Tco_0886503 [Tanacetum coccineum]